MTRPPPPPTTQELIDDWQQHQSRNDKADFKEHPAVLRDPTAPFSMGPKITGGQAEVGGLGIVEKSWEGWRGSLAIVTAHSFECIANYFDSDFQA